LLIGNNMTALDGIRVLDFTRVLAGPYCTLVLGDLGAEIIKIENPQGGDDTRGFNVSPTLDFSTYFLAVNRNKKSVAIDIRTTEGRNAIHAMAVNADVVIENYRSGVMERYGIGYEDLSQINPRLVFASVSAYGRDGPLKDRPGYDPIVQAESGFMSLTGEPDGEPMRTGVSIADMFTGMFAAQAITAALFARVTIGQGQRIDVPLFDTSVNMLHHASGAYLVDEFVTGRYGNGNILAQPVGLFMAGDGPIMIAMTNNRLYAKFCEVVLQKPELMTDPRFAENAGRVANREALTEELNAVFSTDTRSNWIAKMMDAGIPAGEVRDVEEALTSKETIARGMIVDQPHPRFGTIRGIRSPMTLSETPVRDPEAAPDLGADTDEVLRELAGYSDEQIAALKAANN
jgi:crotonobetainyl-CoA:carnitine CoA-transferase CaiB-like acyl-CoA transferase